MAADGVDGEGLAGVHDGAMVAGWTGGRVG